MGYRWRVSTLRKLLQDSTFHPFVLPTARSCLNGTALDDWPS